MVVWPVCDWWPLFFRFIHHSLLRLARKLTYYIGWLEHCVRQNMQEHRSLILNNNNTINTNAHIEWSVERSEKERKRNGAYGIHILLRFGFCRSHLFTRFDSSYVIQCEILLHGLLLLLPLLLLFFLRNGLNNTQHTETYIFLSAQISLPVHIFTFSIICFCSVRPCCCRLISFFRGFHSVHLLFSFSLLISVSNLFFNLCRFVWDHSIFTCPVSIHRIVLLTLFGSFTHTMQRTSI